MQPYAPELLSVLCIISLKSSGWFPEGSVALLLPCLAASMSQLLGDERWERCRGLFDSLIIVGGVRTEALIDFVLVENSNPTSDLVPYGHGFRVFNPSIVRNFQRFFVGYCGVVVVVAEFFILNAPRGATCPLLLSVVAFCPCCGVANHHPPAFAYV